MPDWGAAVARAGAWVATGADLAPGKTLFLEPALTDAPDTQVLLFETGGTWDTTRGAQAWTLLLVVRAPRLDLARALARDALLGAVHGFQTAPAADRGDIRAVRIARLPQLQPRDERGRVLLEASLTLDLHAPFTHGRERDA